MTNFFPKLQNSINRLPLRFILTPLFLLAFAIIYIPALSQQFFQDDFLLLDISRLQPGQSILSFFLPITDFPYRPLATHLTFSLTRNLFGLNPFLHHLFFMLWFLLNSYLVFLLIKSLTKSTSKSLLGCFLYLISATHYMTIYWIATAYFLQGTTFFLLSFILFSRFTKYPSRLRFYLSFITFCLATLFNEATLTLPIILVTYLLLIKRPQRLKYYLLTTLPFFLFSLLSFVFRQVNANKPDIIDYQYSLSPLTFLKTSKWYILRTLSLPEGIDFVPQKNLIYLLLLVFGSLVANLAYRNKSLIPKNINLLIFCIFWFVFGALPFFFLPNHMSSYYLEIAQIGPILALTTLIHIPPSLPKRGLGGVLSHNFTSNLPTISLALIFFLLSFFSVNSMRQTHWVTRRAQISSQIVPQLLKQCPKGNSLQPVNIDISPNHLNELPVVTYNFKAVKLYCNTDQIIIKTI